MRQHEEQQQEQQVKSALGTCWVRSKVCYTFKQGAADASRAIFYLIRFWFGNWVAAHTMSTWMCPTCTPVPLHQSNKSNMKFAVENNDRVRIPVESQTSPDNCAQQSQVHRDTWVFCCCCRKNSSSSSFRLSCAFSLFLFFPVRCVCVCVFLVIWFSQRGEICQRRAPMLTLHLLLLLKTKVDKKTCAEFSILSTPPPSLVRSSVCVILHVVCFLIETIFDLIFPTIIERGLRTAQRTRQFVVLQKSKKIHKKVGGTCQAPLPLFRSLPLPAIWRRVDEALSVKFTVTNFVARRQLLSPLSLSSFFSSQLFLFFGSCCENAHVFVVSITVCADFDLLPHTHTYTQVYCLCPRAFCLSFNLKFTQSVSASHCQFVSPTVRLAWHFQLTVASTLW